MMTTIFDFTSEQGDELQVLGELSWLVELRRREEHGVRVGIDLDEAQVRAANLIAEAHGLLIEEAVEHIVLVALQEATMAITRPGMSMAEVNNAMQEHSKRIASELRVRRLTGGANGHAIVTP